jgi:hypothetical protein
MHHRDHEYKHGEHDYAGLILHYQEKITACVIRGAFSKVNDCACENTSVMPTV